MKLVIDYEMSVTDNNLFFPSSLRLKGFHSLVNQKIASIYYMFRKNVNLISAYICKKLDSINMVLENPPIYHIIHMDRLASITSDGYLYSDRAMQQRNNNGTNIGTNIGMQKIKTRRLTNILKSRSPLCVGDCVPFYFCPRSVMLYMCSRGNHSELSYRGGQAPIIHLETNMLETIDWAENNNKKWCFTTTNAGSVYFEDYSDIKDLDKINWEAVNSNDWKEQREYKQAEFLVENKFPWELVSRIGLYSDTKMDEANKIIKNFAHQPRLEVLPSWYY